jgi:hypothetical protein
MANSKIIAFRSDKELYFELEQGKLEFGFKNDSDFIRYLIRNARKDDSNIRVIQELHLIRDNIELLCITNGVQPLKPHKSQKHA